MLEEFFKKISVEAQTLVRMGIHPHEYMYVNPTYMSTSERLGR